MREPLSVRRAYAARMLSSLLLLVLLLAGCTGFGRTAPGGTPVVLPTADPAAAGSLDPDVTVVPSTPTLDVTTSEGGFTVHSTPVQFIMALVTVNIRQGPGTEHPIVGQIAEGMIARVTGANPEGTWWRVVCPDETLGDCWVSADPTLTREAGGAPMDAPQGGEPVHETGAATVESIEVRMLESLPIQFQAVVRGYLPDGCTTISGVQQVREATTFRIRMSTQRPADAVCTQALVPFEEVVTLDVGGLPVGVYQVSVNELWTSFELTGAGANQTSYPVIETPVTHVMARSDLSIFAGPGSQFTRLGNVAAGMVALVTGSSPDGQWWRVICPDSSVGDCWISADQALTETITPTPAPPSTPES